MGQASTNSSEPNAVLLEGLGVFPNNPTVVAVVRGGSRRLSMGVLLTSRLEADAV